MKNEKEHNIKEKTRIPEKKCHEDILWFCVIHPFQVGSSGVLSGKQKCSSPSLTRTGFILRSDHEWVHEWKFGGSWVVWQWGKAGEQVGQGEEGVGLPMNETLEAETVPSGHMVPRKGGDNLHIRLPPPALPPASLGLNLPIWPKGSCRVKCAFIHSTSMYTG